MKRCTKCGEKKPKSEFYNYKSLNGKCHSSCKKCCRKASIKWGKENRKRKNANERKRRAANPIIDKETPLKRFGLTFENYQQMLEAQNGVCKICGKPEKSKRKDKLKRLAVDHDHKTKHLRGLLCSKCNMLIGLAQDNIQTLESAIKYLKYGRIHGIMFGI